MRRVGHHNTTLCCAVRCCVGLYSWTHSPATLTHCLLTHWLCVPLFQHTAIPLPSCLFHISLSVWILNQPLTPSLTTLHSQSTTHASPWTRTLALTSTRFSHPPSIPHTCIQRKYQMAFDEVFATQYSSVHRLETNKLRNVAKFFAHLLGTRSLQNRIESKNCTFYVLDTTGTTLFWVVLKLDFIYRSQQMR